MILELEALEARCVPNAALAAQFAAVEGPAIAGYAQYLQGIVQSGGQLGLFGLIQLSQETPSQQQAFESAVQGGHGALQQWAFGQLEDYVTVMGEVDAWIAGLPG